jgi:hypothetical protein
LPYIKKSLILCGPFKILLPFSAHLILIALNYSFAASVMSRVFFIISIKWNIAVVDENIVSKDPTV